MQKIMTIVTIIMSLALSLSCKDKKETSSKNVNVETRAPKTVFSSKDKLSINEQIGWKLMVSEEEKEAKYKLEILTKHPILNQKGRWLRVTVKEGSFLFCDGVSACIGFHKGSARDRDLTLVDLDVLNDWPSKFDPAPIKTLSGNDAPLQFLGTKGTEYETHHVNHHPVTGQKGHWMQIKVKKGSLQIKNGSNSVILEPSNNPPFINLDEPVGDLNNLD